MFLYFLQKRQLSPEPGSGGYSLDDLETDDEIIEDPKDKDNTLDDLEDKPKDPTDEEKQKEIDDAAAKQADADTKAADLAEKAKQAEADAKKPEADAPEGGDEEGSTFWDDVDKLRGETLDVDYGDVDPETPEGAIIRENAVAVDAVTKFENHLEAAAPKAYAYLLHKLEGGTDEDFFQLSAGTGDLPTADQLEADIELQKQIVTQNLKSKGMNDKMISGIIKNAITDDDLEEIAKAALVEEEKTKSDKLDNIKKSADAETVRKQESIKKMVEYVDAVVSTGKVDNITIPEKDRKAFAQEFNKSVRYENGKFLLVTELNDDNIAAAFKKEFFNFKKGNLDELITRAAKTENANRLKRTLAKDVRTKGSPGGGPDVTSFSEVE